MCNLYSFFLCFAAYGVADSIKTIFQSFTNTLHFAVFVHLSFLFTDNIA